MDERTPIPADRLTEVEARVKERLLKFEEIRGFL